MFISQSSIDEHELGLARSVMQGNADFPVASFKSFKRRMYQIQQMCIFEDEEAKRYGYLKNKMMKTQDKVYREQIGSKRKDEKKRSASIDLGGICANKNYSGKYSGIISHILCDIACVICTTYLGICTFFSNRTFLTHSLEGYAAESILKSRIYQSRIERPTVFTNSNKRRSSVFF